MQSLVKGVRVWWSISSNSTKRVLFRKNAMGSTWNHCDFIETQKLSKVKKQDREKAVSFRSCSKEWVRVNCQEARFISSLKSIWSLLFGAVSKLYFVICVCGSKDAVYLQFPFFVRQKPPVETLSIWQSMSNWEKSCLCFQCGKSFITLSKCYAVIKTTQSFTALPLDIFTSICFWRFFLICSPL